MIARLAVLAAVLLTAILFQSVVAPAMSLGAFRPHFLLLTVIALALAEGPGVGARYGFAAGLAADLLSGGGPPVGSMALVSLATGHGVGVIRPYLSGTALWGQLVLTGTATAGAIMAFGGLGTVLDTGPHGLLTIVWSGIASGVYNALLGAAVVPLMAALARRIAPAGSVG